MSIVSLAPPFLHVLEAYPLELRRSTISGIVRFLLDGGATSPALATDTHVTWSMEVTGAAFGLPLEDVELMMSVIRLYDGWLLRGTRPAPVAAHENQYVQVVCRQLRLIFAERSGPQQTLIALKGHVDLGRAALDLIWNVVRGLHARLADATWSLLVDTVVGAADRLLAAAATTGATLANGLAAALLRALFDVWLCTAISPPSSPLPHKIYLACLFRPLTLVPFSRHLSFDLCRCTKVVAFAVDPCRGRLRRYVRRTATASYLWFCPPPC